jgi:hypothetical protein
MEAAFSPTNSMKTPGREFRNSRSPVSLRDAALALSLLGIAGVLSGNVVVLALVVMIAGVLGALCLLHWLLTEYPLEPD